MSSVGALSGERMRTLMVPALTATRAGGKWTVAPGWLGTTSSDIIFFEGYFDCSGYTKDGLTVFPTGATLQDPGMYTSSNDAVPMQVLDIISQVQLDREQVYTDLIAGAVPGMLATDTDYTQIIWGQYRMMLGQATFQSATTQFLTASSGLFGSGSPSTAEKLWVYRYVLLPGAADADTIRAPASRFVLDTIVADEDEKAFLMRQKRSYELTS